MVKSHPDCVLPREVEHDIIIEVHQQWLKMAMGLTPAQMVKLYPQTGNCSVGDFSEW